MQVTTAFLEESPSQEWFCRGKPGLLLCSLARDVEQEARAEGRKPSKPGRLRHALLGTGKQMHGLKGSGLPYSSR